MRSLAQRIEAFIKLIGKICSWALAILLTAIVSQVFLRYAFGITSSMLEDSLWYLFAMVFVLGLSYTMSTDGHVRVDFLYQRYSDKTKKIVDCVGIIFFLIPMYAFLFWHGWKYAANSFSINESSPNPGGMPWIWLVKGMLPLSALLLIIESLARIALIITDRKHADAHPPYGS